MFPLPPLSVRWPGPPFMKPGEDEMGNDNLEVLRITGEPLLRVRLDKTPLDKWKQLELSDSVYDRTLSNPEQGLAIKLGGDAGLIDIEGDGDDAKEKWQQLTAGLDVPKTCTWKSARGPHQIFRLDDKTRKIVGEGVVKHGGLEIRLGSRDAYTHYSIVPNCGGRKWVGGPSIAPLPIELAERIQALRASSVPDAENTHENTNTDPDAPGSIFNERMTWDALLTEDGWTYAGARDGADDWKRPGETDKPRSATTKYCGDKLYVFTTSVEGLDPNNAYDKFAYWTFTRHEGDFAASARDLREQGYQPSFSDPFDDIEETSQPCEDSSQNANTEDETTDIPTELLLFPGFVERFAKWHAARSYRYDIRAGAVAGIMIQSWLMGRKVCLEDGTRPNLFAMYTTPSGFGKTAAVGSMKRMLESIGCTDALFSQFKSWQAMEENLEETPNMIVVQEEVQDFLEAMDGGRNPSKMEFASFMKEMATASKSCYRARSARKADGGAGAQIDQPHVATLMTGITEDVWAAFTPKLLKDGTLGRFWMIQSDKLAPDNQPKENSATLDELKRHAVQWIHMDVAQEEPPEAANADQPTIGRILPTSICRDPEAEILAMEFKARCSVEVQKSHDEGSVGGAAWSRANEMKCRFELLIAGSANAISCRVTEDMAKRATELCLISVKQKIELMENQGNIDPAFEQRCKKVLAYLTRQDIKGVRKVDRRNVYRACRLRAMEMTEVIVHLHMRREMYTDSLFNADGMRINKLGQYLCLWKHRKQITRGKNEQS